MEASLIEVLGSEVRIVTEFGILKGKWESPDKPQIKKYFLEVNVDEIINIDAISISDIEYAVQCNKDEIYLYGFVEAIEDDVLFLRLSKEILMLEVSKEKGWVLFIKKYVKVKVMQLYFYDTGLV